MTKKSGWHGEPRRHGLARRGIRTALQSRGNGIRTEDEILDMKIKDFQRDFCPYGYLDIRAAINHLNAYGYDYNDLIEMVEEFSRDTETHINDIDIVWLAYDRILQEVRNTIDSEIDFDIQNDASFDVYGNYMATTYDIGEEDTEKLIKAIKKANKESRQSLLSNENVVTFLIDAVDMKESDINKMIK